MRAAPGDRRAHPRRVPALERVARAVRHEHERWDGDGYPDGLAGEAIPLAVAHRPRLRRLARARQRSPLPHGARSREAGLPSCAAAPERSSTPASSPHSSSRSTAPRGAAVLGLDADAGAVLASIFPDSLERELVALISVATAVAAAPSHRRRARGRGRGGARRDRSLDAVDRALPPRQRHRPDADQRRRSGADRAAPPRRRDLPARGRRRDAHRDQGRRHALRLARRPRPAGHRARAAPGARQALLRRRADHVRRDGLGDLGEPHRGPPAVRRPRRALPARDRRQIGGAIGRAEAFSQISEIASRDGLTGLANRRAFDESLELARDRGAP